MEARGAVEAAPSQASLTEQSRSGLVRRQTPLIGELVHSIADSVLLVLEFVVATWGDELFGAPVVTPRPYTFSRVNLSANEIPIAESTKVKWMTATTATILMLSKLRSPLR